MLARSAWIWIALITACAGLVASKSPSVVYELISAYQVYKTAWKYRGAGQNLIFRHLDPEKDQDLWKYSYKQQGHKGSLAQGQMDWKEFTLAWLADNDLAPEKIPELDEKDLTKTAKSLITDVDAAKFIKVQLAAGKIPENGAGSGPKYHEVLKTWSDMVKDARRSLGDSKLATELDVIRRASERAAFIRRAEFEKVAYFGKDLEEMFPGLDVKSKLVGIDEFQIVYEVVDVQATLTDPKNKENMPKILKLSSADDWVTKFIQRVDDYGITRSGTTKSQIKRDGIAVSHQRVLANVQEFARAAGKDVCK